MWLILLVLLAFTRAVRVEVLGLQTNPDDQDSKRSHTMVRNNDPANAVPCDPDAVTALRMTLQEGKEFRVEGKVEFASSETPSGTITYHGLSGEGADDEEMRLVGKRWPVGPVFGIEGAETTPSGDVYYFSHLLAVTSAAPNGPFTLQLSYQVAGSTIVYYQCLDMNLEARARTAILTNIIIGVGAAFALVCVAVIVLVVCRRSSKGMNLVSQSVDAPPPRKRKKTKDVNPAPDHAQFVQGSKTRESDSGRSGREPLLKVRSDRHVAGVSPTPLDVSFRSRSQPSIGNPPANFNDIAALRASSPPSGDALQAANATTDDSNSNNSDNDNDNIDKGNPADTISQQKVADQTLVAGEVPEADDAPVAIRIVPPPADASVARAQRGHARRQRSRSSSLHSSRRSSSMVGSATSSPRTTPVTTTRDLMGHPGSPLGQPGSPLGLFSRAQRANNKTGGTLERRLSGARSTSPRTSASGRVLRRRASLSQKKLRTRVPLPSRSPPPSTSPHAGGDKAARVRRSARRRASTGEQSGTVGARKVWRPSAAGGAPAPRTVRGVAPLSNLGSGMGAFRAPMSADLVPSNPFLTLEPAVVAHTLTQAQRRPVADVLAPVKAAQAAAKESEDEELSSLEDSDGV